jgi:O-antigen ligase
MIPAFGTVGLLVGILASGIGILAIIAKGRVRRPGLGHALMALFVTWAALSYLWSDDPEGTLVEVGVYGRSLIMVWLIWEFSSAEREQIRLLQAYVLGTFVSSIDTLYQFLSHKEAAYQRYAGAGSNPDDLGLIMALSIPVSYYLMIQIKGRTAWLYRIQLILAGTSILLSAARGSVLAALVGLSIVPLTSRRLTRHQKLVTVPATALLVCAGLFFVPTTSLERLSAIPKELAQGTLSGRTFIWVAGFEVFREHPFLGVGAGAFSQSVLPSLLSRQVAHNTLLSLLVELGVIGLGLFCALLGVLVLSANELPWLPKTLWLVSLGVWLVGVSSLSWEMRKPTWLFFGLLLAQRASLV